MWERPAGATKVRPYEEGALFATNQKQFYQEIDGRSNISNKAPDSQEASEF